jgi:MFS family permease
VVIERYTAVVHLRAVVGQGALVGVFLLNEYVARKGLGASRWHILALLLLPALTQLSAVVWNPAMPGRLLGARPFRVLGQGVHLLLFLPLLLVFATGPTSLVALLAVCGVAQVLLVPLQNGILARNYPEARRGRRFGTATAVQALAIVLVSVPAGWWLDRDPGAWRYLYGFAALAAVFAYRQWGRLRRRRPPPPPPHLESHASPWQALRRDRHFLAFEACFMAYGLGFLALQPVLPLYLVDELGVGYGQVGLARGALFWITMAVASLWLGRVGDRLGVLRLGALSFLTLGLFPAVLLVVPGDAGLYLGFAVYGLAMAGVSLTWNLGPILLARGRDPHPYLNAHISLVGVRALVGMVGATLVQQALGSRAVFVGVVGLEVVAAAGMWWTARATGRRWTASPEGPPAPPTPPPR